MPYCGMHEMKVEVLELKTEKLLGHCDLVSVDSVRTLLAVDTPVKLSPVENQIYPVKKPDVMLKVSYLVYCLLEAQMLPGFEEYEEAENS